MTSVIPIANAVWKKYNCWIIVPEGRFYTECD